MDYIAMIQSRESVRAFNDTEVPAAALAEIETYFAGGCKKLIPSLAVELRIFGSDAQEKLEGTAGYRDFLIGAPCYLLVLSDEADHYVENAGFIAEDLVLKITELDLCSCWLTFCDGEKIKTALGIQSDKRVAAIVAFGYGRKAEKVLHLNIQNNSIVDVDIRRTYYAPKKGIDDLVYNEKWGRKEGVYDHIGHIGSTLWQALYAASLSPSYLNRQPYGFILDGGDVVLVSQEEECTDGLNQALNLGIVMLHISGVLAQKLYEVPWVLEAPAKDYGLPAGCRAVACCKVYP
jgi:nitroreductase